MNFNVVSRVALVKLRSSEYETTLEKLSSFEVRCLSQWTEVALGGCITWSQEALFGTRQYLGRGWESKGDSSVNHQ